MTKTMITPLVAVLAIAIKAVFNIEVPETVQAQVTEFVVGAGALYVVVRGIIKNHKKEGEK